MASLEITIAAVRDAEEKGGGRHAEYLVECRAATSGKLLSSCWRRFRQFEALNRQLRAARLPTLRLPPKTFLGKPANIEHRRKGLQRALQEHAQSQRRLSRPFLEWLEAERPERQDAALREAVAFLRADAAATASEGALRGRLLTLALSLLVLAIAAAVQAPSDRAMGSGHGSGSILTASEAVLLLLGVGVGLAIGVLAWELSAHARRALLLDEGGDEAAAAFGGEKRRRSWSREEVLADITAALAEPWASGGHAVPLLASGEDLLATPRPADRRNPREAAGAASCVSVQRSCRTTESSGAAFGVGLSVEAAEMVEVEEEGEDEKMDATSPFSSTTTLASLTGSPGGPLPALLTQVSQELEQAFDCLNMSIGDATNFAGRPWEEKYRADGVEIWSSALPGEKRRLWKTRMRVVVPSIEDVRIAAVDWPVRLTWDRNFTEGAVLRTFAGGQRLVRCVCAGQAGVVSGREFVEVNEVRWFNEGDRNCGFASVAVASNEELPPEARGRGSKVRARNLPGSGLICKPVWPAPNNVRGEVAVDVVMLANVDLGGWLPQKAINATFCSAMVSTNVSLRDFLVKKQRSAAAAAAAASQRHA